MLKRSCPRASTARVTGKGNVSTNFPRCLPLYKCSSSRSCPRPRCLPQTDARRGHRRKTCCRRAARIWVDRPSSADNRQPQRNQTPAKRAALDLAPSPRAATDRVAMPRSPFDPANLANSLVPFTVQLHTLPEVRKLSRNRRVASLVEFRIGRFDAQKKSISLASWKRSHVENRMIGHRQTVERQQPENRGEPRHEYRQLESDRDEDRPAVQRAPADVQRIVDHRNPILQVKARRCSRRCRRSEPTKASRVR